MFANEVLVCYLLPIHVGLHRAYHLFTTIIHEGAPLPSTHGGGVPMRGLCACNGRGVGVGARPAW